MNDKLTVHSYTRWLDRLWHKDCDYEDTKTDDEMLSNGSTNTKPKDKQLCKKCKEARKDL